MLTRMLSQMVITKFITKHAVICLRPKIYYTWAILQVVIGQLQKQRNILYKAMAVFIAVMPAIQAKK